MKTLVHLSILLALTSLLFFSCKKEKSPEPIPEKYITLASGTISDLNLEVSILAEEEAFVGYDRLYIRLRDRDQDRLRTNAKVTIQPIMTMPMMTHSAPVEQPGVANEEGLFAGSVVFIMPSSAGDWDLKITVEDQDLGKNGEVMLRLQVKEKKETKLRQAIAQTDGAKLFISLVEPRNPKVGMNDFEVAVHYKQDMMNFPPVTDFDIEIEPEMPTMGHGSPDNEHPQHTGKGHYRGKVNYTMTGLWRVHVRLRQQNQLAAEVSFDMTF